MDDQSFDTPVDMMEQEETVETGQLWSIRPIVSEFRDIINCEQFEYYLPLTSKLYRSCIFESIVKADTIDSCLNFQNQATVSMRNSSKSKRQTFLKWVYKNRLAAAKYFLVKIQTSETLAPEKLQLWREFNARFYVLYRRARHCSPSDRELVEQRKELLNLLYLLSLQLKVYCNSL